MNLKMRGGLHITSNEKISGRRSGYGARFRIDGVRGRSDGVGEMKYGGGGNQWKYMGGNEYLYYYYCYLLLYALTMRMMLRWR